MINYLYVYSHIFFMKVKVDEAIYDISSRLENLEKKLSILEGKVNISIDALENKIKEVEGLIAVIDDDYYEIRKEVLNKLSTLSPYLDEIKKIEDWKKEIEKEMRELEEGVKKMGKLIVKFNEDLNMIKKIMRMK